MRSVPKVLGVCIVQHLFNAPVSGIGWVETVRYILSESLMIYASVAGVIGSACGVAFLRGASKVALCHILQLYSRRLKQGRDKCFPRGMQQGVQLPCPALLPAAKLSFQNSPL